MTVPPSRPQESGTKLAQWFNSLRFRSTLESVAASILLLLEQITRVIAGVVVYLLVFAGLYLSACAVLLLPALYAQVAQAWEMGSAVVAWATTNLTHCQDGVSGAGAVSVTVLVLMAMYSLLGVLTWLVSRVKGSWEGLPFTILGGASAVVLGAAALVPIAWFMTPALLHDAMPMIDSAGDCRPALKSLRDSFTDYYWIPLLLGFVIACTYIYIPRPGHFYYRVVFPRRTVWLTFAVVLFSTIWLTAALGIDLKVRASTAQPLLDHTAAAAARLEPLARGAWSPLAAELGVTGLKRDVTELATIVAASPLPATASEATPAPTTATVTTPAPVPPLDHPDVMRVGVENVVLLTNQLVADQRLGPSAVGDGTTVGEHRKSLVHTIAATLADLANVSTLSYFTVAVLYAIFLLLPWIIYIVYITARRGKVTSQTVADLKRFGILEQVCARQPLDNRDVDLAKQWWETPPAADDLKRFHWSARRVFTPEVLTALMAERTAPQPKSELYQRAKKDAAQFIVGRAQFYSLQYLVPLSLLSIVSAIGWYYTFLAGTLTNLYEFIRAGGATPLLSAMLMDNVTPFTAAFLGGWIFVTMMLLNSWTRDDLYPRTYFYATAHLMIAMIVGFAFAAALGRSENVDLAVPITFAALLISLVPYDSVGLFTQKWLAYVRDIFQFRPAASTPPEGGGKNEPTTETLGSIWISHELQRLPNVTLWDETRLHQEGIDSVGDLAGADLERLVLQTQYSGHRIAQWVDTALLRTHASGATATALGQNDVLTATDLFLAAYGKAGVDKLLAQRKAQPEERASLGPAVLQAIQELPRTPPAAGEKELAETRYALLASLALERNLGAVLAYRFSAP